MLTELSQFCYLLKVMHVHLSKWHPAEPEGKPGHICMVGLSSGEVSSQDYFWADLQCDARYPYVCEMKP